ncbi:hypothetical protein V6C27_03175 [Peptococcaceae bacterium 1198_IL3148]
MKRKPSQRENPDPISSYDPPSFKVKKPTLQNFAPKQGTNSRYSNDTVDKWEKE